MSNAVYNTARPPPPDSYDEFPDKGIQTSNVIQPTGKECDPEHARFIAGAQAGLFALRYSANDRRVAKTFDFIPFGTLRRFNVYEPSHAGEQGDYVGTYDTKPADATWRPNANGKKKCLLANDNEVKEQVLAFMIELATKQPICFEAHSTGIKPIDEMLSTAKRMSVRYRFAGEAETLVTGPMVGKWQMEAFAQSQSAYRWYVAKARLLGKLGEEGGPSIQEYRLALQARATLKQGLDLSETLKLEAPATAPVAAPAAIERGRMTVTSGRPTAREEGPMVEAPPPAEYDGPDDVTDLS